MAYREELIEETLRVYGRYATEVVERFGYCPWARSSRESGSVVVRCILSADRNDFAESLRLLRELSPEPSTGVLTEVALIIYPLLDLNRLDFEDFVRRLRQHADNTLGEQAGAFAMAAFHPAAVADTSHPDRLVPYVRRTPDPTLQLVRNSTLSSIKGLAQGTAFVDLEQLSATGLWELARPQPGLPPSTTVRAKIAEQNLATVLEVGPAAIDRVHQDILSDREQVHARLFARYAERGPVRTGTG